MPASLQNFIKGIPKAELHIHIEGSFEPELMFKIAQRNNIAIKFKSVEEIRAAYNFNNLQDFLDIYYQGAGVLTTEQDFYDLAWAYLQKAHAQNVKVAEIFFDPQTHTDRGIPFATVINGLHRACQDASEKLGGMDARLILCFLRHLSEEAAMKTLTEALPHKNKFFAVGLDSSEVGNPPSKFKNVYKKADDEGLKRVAHAGEEGPAQYVWEALNLLQITRVDHGNHALDDEKLVKELVDHQIPLTVCPLSNLKLKVVKDLKDHPLKKMLDLHLLATINSDDPAYFGGYINDNYIAVAEALNLTPGDIVKLAKNSFQAAFLSDETKQKYFSAIDDYAKNNPL